MMQLADNIIAGDVMADDITADDALNYTIKCILSDRNNVNRRPLLNDFDVIIIIFNDSI